jgi:prepilin-type N-terminal cleavage/methylation domain-containing protein
MSIKNFSKKSFTLTSGFTLIELLIVVAIIAALAVTVFVALDPSTRLKQANDVRRQTDADTILSAIHTSIVDNKGVTLTNMPAANAERQLGTGDATVCAAAVTTGGCNTPAATACVDLLSGANNLSKYLKSMPIDPLGGTTYTAGKTGYSVVVDSNGIVTIKACGTQGTTNVSVSR